jgi:hypothetical protein
MWLGMNNIKNGIIPNTWQYDNTKVDFVGFLKNYPSKDETQTAVIMQHSEGEEFGMWKNRKPDNPSYPGNCFCSKNAINGAPDPPSYPQVPDFSQWCDKNWWLLDSGTVPNPLKCKKNPKKSRHFKGAKGIMRISRGHAFFLEKNCFFLDIFMFFDSLNNSTQKTNCGLLKYQ